MTCLICKKGETALGKITITLERGGATVVIRNVLGQVCKNCGEEYVDEKTTSSLLKTAEAAVQSGTLIDILEFKAA